MSHPLVRIAAVVAVALAAVVGFSEARSTSRPAGARAAACHSRLSLVAHGSGSPDDLAWDGRTLLASEINQGTITAIAHGHTRTLVAHIRAPEGIVAGPGHSLIVAEQKTNRVLEIELPKGSRTTLAKLPLPLKKEGIDGINADGPAAAFVPDSARGRLYVLDLPSRRLSLIASGMIRPVAAINWRGTVVVADEYANAVWMISHRRRTRLATVAVPDDLAVISHHLIATSLLGDVWEVAPHLRMLSSAFSPAASDPQGMVADGPDALLIADESRNAVYRLSRLSGCL